LLPGMTAPVDNSNAKKPPGYTGEVQQVLPDGNILVREFVNGQRVSETWFSSLRLPLRAVYYVNDTIVGGTAKFGPDGKMTQRTYYYLGTTQPQRVEEYSDGEHVSKFTTYWQNGNLAMVSENDVPTPTGRINRVREWYPNGEPKSLTQVTVERDSQGQIINEEKQGRQTTWNQAGFVTYDMDYNSGVPVYDHLRDKAITPDEAAASP
jgi:hypothetical protein